MTTPRPPDDTARDDEDGPLILADLLSLGDGFSLLIVECDSPRALTDGLARAAEAVEAETGHPLTVVRPDPYAAHASPLDAIPEELLIDAVLVPLTTAPPPGAVGRLAWVLDGSAARPRDLAAWSGLFRRLNERRNLVAERLDTALLLCGPAELLRAFSREAPDFWSISTTVAPLRMVSPDTGAVDTADPGGAAQARPSLETEIATQTEAVDLHRRLGALQPGRPRHREELAAALTELGDLHREAGDAEAACRALEEALQVRTQLLEAAGTPLQADSIAAVRLRLADLLLETGRVAEACGQLDAAVQGWRDLHAEAPKSPEWRRRLGTALAARARARVLAGHADEGRAGYQEARRLLDGLLREGPDLPELRRDLAGVLLALGDLDRQAGDARAALASYEEALRVVRGLAEARVQVATALSRLEALHEARGEPARAAAVASQRRRVPVLLYAGDDVEAERARVPGVLDRLNGGALQGLGLRCELLDAPRARTPRDGVPPRAWFHPGLDEAEVVVLVLWSRLGGPAGSASEVARDVGRALASRRDRGSPAVLAYVCRRPVDSEDEEVLARLEEVIDLRRDLAPDIVVREYVSAEDLDGALEDDLLATVSGLMDTPAPAPPDLRAWLEALEGRTAHLDVRGVGSAPGKVRTAGRHPIESLYTPLRSRSGGSDGGTERGAEALSGLLRHPRLLLEGQPGAGKTTFARLVACLLARDRLGRPCPAGGSCRSDYLGLPDDEPARLPVLVALADLVPLLAAAGASRHRREEWLLELLAQDGEEGPLRASHWRRAFAAGEAVLLLDGLDEVAEPRLREEVFGIVEAALSAWPECPVVVTSRPFDTGRLTDLGFTHAVIEPFGRGEIAEFVTRWVAALYDVAIREADALPEVGREYRAALELALTTRAEVRRLASNPVMLTCLCVVHWNEGRLPEGRARVYRAVLRWLLAARSRQRQAAGFSDRLAETAFARLALAMMEAGGGKRTVLDLADAARAVESVVRRHFPELGHAQERQARAAEWLGFECLGSGIVEEVAGNRVRFWHLTFQEHLAAVQLAWREEGEASERDEEGQERHWWPAVRPRLSDAQWRETVDLLPGCLLDEGGEGRVDRLLERVLALRGERPDLAAEARVAGVTGRLLAHVRVYGYRPPPAVEQAYGEALARALEVFTPEGAARVPVADRIAAAEALGQAGDPRLAVPQVERLLPVPGRPGLLLGRYPVTVEEYRAFVDVRGYEERRWWTEAGWSAREEGGWEAPDEWEAQLRTPNRPVVRVSWHEAVAYCRWLSDLCGREVRLPEEEVWEAAAMHPDGPYPWGAAEPDAERANFAPDRKPNVGASTPVGVYPAGAGRGGHLDLGGNVWEWCADRATVVDGEEDERALRGGAWDFSRVELRVAYRFRHVAVVRWYLVGFRISSSPVSPEA